MSIFIEAETLMAGSLSATVSPDGEAEWDNQRAYGKEFDVSHLWTEGRVQYEF